MNATRAAVVCVWLLACSHRDARRSVDSAAAANSRLSAAPIATNCVHTGLWDACTLRDRLERTGLAPIAGDSLLHSPLFSVAGRSYAIGHGRLDVFIYPSAADLARDVAKLDTTRAQLRDGSAPVTWESPPTLITNNNLAAILLTNSDRQIERVSDALTAGAPLKDPP